MFICGETEAIVPEMMVPLYTFPISLPLTVFLVRDYFVVPLQFNRHRLVLAFHKKSGGENNR